MMKISKYELDTTDSLVVSLLSLNRREKIILKELVSRREMSATITLEQAKELGFPSYTNFYPVCSSLFKLTFTDLDSRRTIYHIFSAITYNNFNKEVTFYWNEDLKDQVEYLQYLFDNFTIFNSLEAINRKDAARFLTLVLADYRNQYVLPKEFEFSITRANLIQILDCFPSYKDYMFHERVLFPISDCLDKVFKDKITIAWSLEKVENQKVYKFLVTFNG